MNLFGETSIPTEVAAAGAALLIVLAVVGIVVAHIRAGRVAARRARANPTPTPDERKTEKRLMIMAVVPSAAVWIAVFTISFIGLSSWARDDMGWNDWSRFIVPLSLDGIAIAQGASAFAAVKRHRSPARAERAVLVGALISATINFWHGWTQWTIPAGLYLGSMSMAGMWLFHDLLRQFQEDHEENQPRRRKVGIPAFGLRWLLAFPSTFAAWRTWIVYPPDNDTIESTVFNALEHRKRTLRDRRADRRASRTELDVLVDERNAAVRAAAAERRTVPDPSRDGYRNGTPVPSRTVPPVPATPIHLNGTALERPGTPGTERNGTHVPAPAVPVSGVPSRSSHNPDKDREELKKIAAEFPEHDTWHKIRGESQNEVYRRTSIRKPRLKVLLYSGDDLAESYFPTPPAPPSGALTGLSGELQQLLDREKVPS